MLFTDRRDEPYSPAHPRHTRRHGRDVSPTRPRTRAAPGAVAAVARIAVQLGMAIHEERVRHRWTLRELGDRAGLSAAAIHAIEAGRAASLDSYARIAHAFAVQLDVNLASDRSRATAQRHDEDLVHAAMGELEARILRGHGFELALDEPYQHFQFAGRADLVAWDRQRRALLHIENKTRLPNVQEALGSFAAKRAYLGPVLAKRLRVGQWRSETHVIVALWSAEILHVLRLRRATFDAACPDPPDAFAAWRAVRPPSAGRTSAIVVLDPLASGRQRAWICLAEAGGARARHRDYAAALAALRAAGLA